MGRAVTKPELIIEMKSRDESFETSVETKFHVLSFTN